MLRNLSYRSLFLIDGVGALVTALLLSQVLARFEDIFGMPRQVLFVLAGIAACFAVYSISCHFLIKEQWRPYLRGIALANMTYCLSTLVLVLYLNRSLTWLGIAYFLGEIVLVMTLVAIEMKKIRMPPEKLPI